MGLSRFQQYLPDLSAFQKATFGGQVPSEGHTGLQIGRIVEELQALGAIPPKPSREAA